MNAASRASVDKDYLIGPIVLEMQYTHGRVFSQRKSQGHVLNVKWAQNNIKQTMTNNGIQQGGTTAIEGRELVQPMVMS